MCWADGAIISAAGLLANTPAIGPLVGLMDAQLSLGARGDVALLVVINPTLMASADTRPRIAPSDGVIFAKPHQQCAALWPSPAGSVDWQPETSREPRIPDTWVKLAQNGPLAERITWTLSYLTPLSMLPATVTVQALGGDLHWTVAGGGDAASIRPAAACNWWPAVTWVCRAAAAVPGWW